MADQEPKPGSRERPYSVSRVITGVNRTLNRVVGSIWMEGELSSVKRPSSGHVYFTLKDHRSQLAAVLWRSEAQRLGFELTEGMTLRCRVRLGLYERDGKFQLYVQAARARRRWAADAARHARGAQTANSPRPRDCSIRRANARSRGCRRRIGVVTSKTGAAVARHHSRRPPALSGSDP